MSARSQARLSSALLREWTSSPTSTAQRNVGTGSLNRATMRSSVRASFSSPTNSTGSLAIHTAIPSPTTVACSAARSTFASIHGLIGMPELHRFRGTRAGDSVPDELIGRTSVGGMVVDRHSHGLCPCQSGGGGRGVDKGCSAPTTARSRRSPCRSPHRRSPPRSRSRCCRRSRATIRHPP
jgi:Tfp pilus tip-associated adhesin PilY1